MRRRSGDRGMPGHASSNAIGYAKFYSRSNDAVIRVYDDAGNVIETHEHAGDFKEWCEEICFMPSIGGLISSL
jgi:hypothetical protein